MNHHHNFKIVLAEVLQNGAYRVTKECECGEEVVEESATGT